MPIQNLQNLDQTLNRYSSNEWAKGVAKDFGENIQGPLNNDGKQANTFGELLSKSIQDINKLQHDANTAIQKLVTGKSKNLHETMLIVEKADLAFRTMNQIRQKVIEAYREVMKTQV